MEEDIGDMIEARFAACANHPKQRPIFELERILLESGYPYYFNFWEELRPTPFNQDGGDPEKDIDWEHYRFIIELDPPGRKVWMPYPTISVCLEADGSLTVMDARPALKEKAMPEELESKAVFYRVQTAQQAMEHIQGIFDDSVGK